MVAVNEDSMYVHSRCCNAHWELVFDNNTKEYQLQCETCGEPAGVKVTGPDTGKTCACAECKCGDKPQ